MKNIGYTIILSLIFSVFLSSCHRKGKKLESSELGFDSLKLSRVYYLDNDSTKPSCHLNISYIYLAKGLPDSVMRKVRSCFISVMFDQAYVDSTQQKAADCYADDYVESYKEDAKSFYRDDPEAEDDDSDRKDYYSYFETLSDRICFNKFNLLSFQVEQKNYKGGENSFTSYHNYVLDLRTGNLLTEESIFNPGYEKVFHALIINKLLQQNNAKDISELEDLGYFGIEEILPNHNFLIDDKGITYIFNKGESSALSMDEIRITLSYKEIEPVLKPNSVLQPLIKE